MGAEAGGGGGEAGAGPEYGDTANSGGIVGDTAGTGNAGVAPDTPDTAASGGLVNDMPGPLGDLTGLGSNGVVDTPPAGDPGPPPGDANTSPGTTLGGVIGDAIDSVLGAYNAISDLFGGGPLTPGGSPTDATGGGTFGIGDDPGSTPADTAGTAVDITANQDAPGGGGEGQGAVSPPAPGTQTSPTDNLLGISDDLWGHGAASGGQSGSDMGVGDTLLTKKFAGLPGGVPLTAQTLLGR